MKARVIKECPCGERGKNGSLSHTNRSKRWVVLIGEFGQITKLRPCTNHIPNYLWAGSSWKVLKKGPKL